MDPILKNILALIAAFIVGMIVNGGLISISGSIIPLPEGVDPNDIKSMNENFHLYEFKHFIMPFLAHALGTLAGAFVVAKFAATYKKELALAIGAFFLLGGATMVFIMLSNSPLWFNILDLVVAYIPMGWLGWFLATKK